MEIIIDTFIYNYFPYLTGIIICYIYFEKKFKEVKQDMENKNYIIEKTIEEVKVDMENKNNIIEKIIEEVKEDIENKNNIIEKTIEELKEDMENKNNIIEKIIEEHIRFIEEHIIVIKELKEDIRNKYNIIEKKIKEVNDGIKTEVFKELLYYRWGGPVGYRSSRTPDNKQRINVTYKNKEILCITRIPGTTSSNNIEGIFDKEYREYDFEKIQYLNLS